MFIAMTAEEIRSLSSPIPFRAFRIHMANGKHVDVPHPDFISLSPRGRTLIVYKPDGSFDLVDVLLITSIETLSNGQRPRRRRKSNR